MTIERTANDSEVDITAVRQAVANVVNGVGFGLGRVPASLLIDAAYTALTGDMVVRSPIQMIGALRRPDGEYLVTRSQTELLVPDLANTTISSRTVGIYMDAADVSVSVTLVDTKAI